MRRPPSNTGLPKWSVQLVGILMLIAMTGYGIAAGNSAILLALMPTALVLLGLSNLDRALREAAKKAAPDDEDDLS